MDEKTDLRNISKAEEQNGFDNRLDVVDLSRWRSKG
jgi:hypothetical protein